MLIRYSCVFPFNNTFANSVISLLIRLELTFSFGQILQTSYKVKTARIFINKVLTDRAHIVDWVEQLTTTQNKSYLTLNGKSILHSNLCIFVYSPISGYLCALTAHRSVCVSVSGYARVSVGGTRPV